MREMGRRADESSMMIRERRCEMSADVSVEWVPYKVIPQNDESGFDVVLHGKKLTDPMPEAVAVVLATTLAKEAAAQGKLGIVARCTGVGEIVSAQFYEPTVV
jgi:hypothetical protein